MEKFVWYLVVILTTVYSVSSLECYTCADQDSNRDKCVKTTKQCEQFQDACTTYVRWGVPPFWSPHGDRIYYITKDCDTRKGCETRQSQLQSHCKRDWYNDWACVECCTGDLCNYYVVLSGSTLKVSIVTMVTAVTGVLLLWRLQ